MKIGKSVLLHLMALMYVGLGMVHLIKPAIYWSVMPAWLPFKLVLIYVSGIVEILLGLLLLRAETRLVAARLIIAMLIVFFFLIHVPMSIDYYQTGHKYFVLSLIRLPVQFVLVAWAWLYAKPKNWHHDVTTRHDD